MYCTSLGNGEAILFIHGMPTNGLLWNGIVQQLSDCHRCFAIDLPGLGKTPRVPYGPGYLDGLVEQIEELRVQHGIQQWHVVGHDAGSAVGAYYAGRFPKSVNCLALLSPAVFPDLKPYCLLNLLRKQFIGEMLAPFVHFVFWRVAMRRAIGQEINRAALHAFYEPFSGPTGSWQLMRLVRWGKPQDILGMMPEVLAGLPMPTLIFHGSRDVLPATFAERAVALIPQSSMVTVDAGHFIPLDQPNFVAASLRGFFQENKSIKML